MLSFFQTELLSAAVAARAFQDYYAIMPVDIILTLSHILFNKQFFPWKRYRILPELRFKITVIIDFSGRV